MKINCSGSNVKLEIQEVLQPNSSGIKTTLVFMNEKGDSAKTVFESRCERTWIPNNESPQHLTNHSEDHNINYTFTFGSTEGHSASVSPTRTWQNPNYCWCCSDHRQLISTDSTHRPSNALPLFNIRAQENRKQFHKSFSTDQFWDVPPPQEFADIRCNTLEDLTFDLASCRIGSCGPAHGQSGELHTAPNFTCKEEPGCPYSAEAEAPSFDHLSESDNYDSMFMRPSLSTNRSSFTKEFISCQKRKSWIRNNSIAIVEHKACPLPKKRRQTFPRMSEGLGLMQEDLLLPYSESFSSMVMCSLSPQSERPSRIEQANDRFPQTKGSSNLDVPNSLDGRASSLSPFCMSSFEYNPDDVFTVNEHGQKRSSIRNHGEDLRHQDFKQSVGRDVESLDTDDCEYKVDQSEVADSGFDQEMGEVEYHSPEPLKEKLSQRALSIQVIPPSCSGSEEMVLQSSPVLLLHNKVDDSNPHKHNKSSVMTITVGALEQRFLQMDSRSSLGGGLEKPLAGPVRDSCISPALDKDSLNTHEVTEETESKPLSEQTENTNTASSDLHLDPGRKTTEEPAVSASCPGDTEVHVKEQRSKQTVSRGSIETKEHLKPVAHKDQESSSDHWAKRRKLFKESKQWSSAGGSSITSDITEESVSEDTRSMDMTIRDNEDRGFYMETFHSSAWIYQGDDEGSGAITPNLNSRTRAVSIRERTVRISKGTGEYPWGFRIQFSKPIVVTEVDTNGAAEEAGLMVGDYVLAVNGTDVTSIPHSEAADLARQGPDILTLTIGSDIACGPNTPRPACRGYLHKRTQSGLIKGWRKRWFVLTHDCCLYYYRHKRDEGKRQALSAVKLEGAEVGQDVSLGKPFVFKCRPQSGSRVYFFCATSNQEMKRWLEAMETAIHPFAQVTSKCVMNQMGFSVVKC
uniref:Uncharacterized LOC111659639 n=1 Tax=Seriola lalandi dorsalis TaxID=1841481 RepID=A0A3B4YPG9_SERLL